VNSVPPAQEAKWNFKHFNMDMDKQLITLCLFQNAGTDIFRTQALKSFVKKAFVELHILTTLPFMLWKFSQTMCTYLLSFLPTIL